MSSFEVKVYRLVIVPHPNADKIELAIVGDYRSIVPKGRYVTGDLAVYIPEQSIVPNNIITELDLEDKLSGGEKNRVKAIRLRGVVSQGLIYPLRKGWREGQDVAEELGIRKWEPVLPANMRGRAVGVAQHITVNYDIENIKKHNNLLQEGEQVVVTEKIHGTFAQFGYIPRRLFESYLYMGCYTVTSKGLGGRGVLLDYCDDANVYARVGRDKRYELGVKLPCIKAEYKNLIGDEPIYILGEIYGPSIQKGFSYGLTGDEIDFRAFDIAFGIRSSLTYLDDDIFSNICNDYEIPCVPWVYRGPYSKDNLVAWNSGKETISGKALHIREGCVVKPLEERRDDRAGRVILKSVSDAYLLRNGDTTEYQ
jgi:RNA ligase (TIGR02306 family)